MSWAEADDASTKVRTNVKMPATTFSFRPCVSKRVVIFISRPGLSQINGHAREWSQFAASYPLVLGPVSTMPPFPVGMDIAGPAELREVLSSMRLVVAINLLGLPAAAVPTGVAGGLPQGVQIIGARFREDLCLDAAEAIEERLGVLTPIDPRS